MQSNVFGTKRDVAIILYMFKLFEQHMSLEVNLNRGKSLKFLAALKSGF